jgi:iron complex transport system permease protein
LTEDLAILKRSYRYMTRKKSIFIVACILLTVIAFFITITVGAYDIGFVDSFRVVIDHMMGNITDIRGDSIVWGIRLPEALMAILVGAALSAGGAVMQTIMRNPLADPYMMGISSGASLGASIAIIFGLCLIPGIAGDNAIVVDAFIFSLIPVVVILIISERGSMTPGRMILAGIAVMFVFSAITSLLMATSDSEKLSDVYTWRVGTLSGIGWNAVPIVAVVTVLGILFIMSQYRRFDVLMSGENGAKCLGVDPKKMMLVGMLVVALITAAAVSFTGTIGFIGLVGPHIARIFVGSESKYLIPAASVFGALFLLFADTIAKVSGPVGLPVGVISALVGGPLFVLILIRQKNKACV